MFGISPFFGRAKCARIEQYEAIRPADYIPAVEARNRRISWNRIMLGVICAIFLMVITLSVVQYSISSVNDTFLPEIRTRRQVFQRETLLGQPLSPDSEAAWENLVPTGHGFVLVPSPEKLGLKPGIPTLDGPDRYQVSMVHQLHCLARIREMYYFALAGNSIKGSKRGHIGHCFDYLRQGILCAGDMTLESAVPFPEEAIQFSVTGWDIPHVCRDWEQIFEWTAAHKPLSNYSGIGS